MKVKMLVRNPDEYIRETSRDLHRHQRNVAPELHPLAITREYTAAVNAAKLDRIFAKPFLCSLGGHRDAVELLAKHPDRISGAVSASADGELRWWDLTNRMCVRSLQAHDGPIRGLTFGQSANVLLTAGQDQSIKQWRGAEIRHTILSKHGIMGLTHHYKSTTFATAGETVSLWEEGRNEPLRSFNWGIDTVYSVYFSPIEYDLLASLSSDRSIVLYDIREASPLRKVVLEMRCNALAFNPMQAMHFTVANENYNLYTFDMRSLNKALQSHTDHVGAVLSVDYSPTGTEFVSGSYDKTVRIYPISSMRSREVYHTKRMQRVTSVMYSLDAKYILSASDEMNIRLWKAKASEQLGIQSFRERNTYNYNATLLERFGYHPEVKRIVRHRHVPKQLYSQIQEKQTMVAAKKRKEIRRRMHTKEKDLRLPGTREQIIVEEQE
ncbi:DDB1- and CUL4-associated factor 13-like [Tropilaelaps mercedesae]|uniref:DDB1-and CUL4-associated factor 13-like n=1 Tax=Tropilaelaps mercedesae TaxID=418985 RepID=A0A1V9Y2A6_9ACAR|nr:DDB1- and CUL4-associated factor 13-like [Tropilaelaps mercedesae]